MFASISFLSLPHPTAIVGHAAAQPARLDVIQLEENVSWYLGKALAPSTTRSYASGQRRFLTFCQDSQVEPSPLVEHTLCMFCAHLAREGLSHQTIKSDLSAIRHCHIMEGKGDPFIANAFPLLQYVLRGIKRSPANPSRQPRLPITPAVLLQLKRVWSPLALTDRDYTMLWAACCLGFFGFMRAGEFTVKTQSDFDPSVSLMTSDISVDSHETPVMVRVVLRQSKTDPFRQGVSIYLGKTQGDLCPVSAILAYIAIRPPVVGPLFVYRDGSFLTRDKLVSALKQALRTAGMDTKGYSGHSFRIGAATTAALKGVEDSVIKMLGRWESSAYQRYLRTPREALAAISSKLIA